VVVGAFAGSLIWFFAAAPAGLRTLTGEIAYVLLVLALVFVLPARSPSDVSAGGRRRELVAP
jgi:hypothetical protein